MPNAFTKLGRIVVVLVGVVLAAGLGWLLFVEVPAGSTTRLLGVLLTSAAALGGARLAGQLARSRIRRYDVGEVEVDDVITRERGPGPVRNVGASANEIVEQIERADADDAVEALIVKLNTPGGQVVPSEDIRTAAANFDGPTVAYAEDLAASGGYWIASGCDEIHARRGSVVGSIGVNGTQLGSTGLAEKLGLDYRRFVAGEYKDTPSRWRDLDDDEVAYVQGLLDDYYEQFVETVVDGTGLDEAFVRETEARTYLGEEAHELGLVDTCGPREEMEARLADRLGVDEIEVREFEPERGLAQRMSVGASRLAHAFGSGLASVVVGDEGPPTRLR